MKAYSSSSSVV